MSAAWIALGAAEGGWRGVAMQGSEMVCAARDAERDAVLEQLVGGDVPILDLGGGPAEATPAAVLPGHGTRIGDLVQAAPTDRLSAWARVEIAGFLAVRGQWDGVLCMVARDVTYWVQISADEVISFQGFATPRLIDLLGGGDEASSDAVSECLSRPEKLAALLRRAEVTGDASLTTGALIGAELAAARPYWLGQQVGIIGDGDAYDTALRAQGVTSERADADAVMGAGLARLADRFG